MLISGSRATLVMFLSLLLSNGVQSQVTAIRRTQSAVVLRPTDSLAVQRKLRRPILTTVQQPPVVATQPDRTSPLVVAAVPDVRVRPAAVAPKDSTRKPAPAVTPQAAAIQLATALYGKKAQTASVRVINDRTASVWVGDAPVKEKAPPGLDAAEGVALPFRFVRVDSAAGDTMALKPWLDQGNGLRYDASRRAFVATIRVGLRDTLHVGRGRALAPAIRLSVAASADTVTPELLEIKETNIFSSTVRLVARRADTLMRVTIWPDFTDREVSIWLKFRRDSLQLTAQPRAIARYGLGEVTLTISAPPGSIAPGDSVAVRLSSQRGTVTQGPVVYLKDGVPAVVQMRSTEMAGDSITVSADSFGDASQRIDYEFPTGLTLGALLGALLGTGMLVLRERSRPDAPGIGWMTASGLIAGLLTALIAAVGIVKIPGFELPATGSAVVSLLAGALGGYIGPKGIEALFKVFGAGRSEKPAT